MVIKKIFRVILILYIFIDLIVESKIYSDDVEEINLLKISVKMFMLAGIIRWL